jgi:hypothetical protein
VSFFKNVLTDLIEKRLWPVAIALVAALVAVPIVLGGSSDPSGTSVAGVTPATAPGSGTSQAEVVSLEEAAAGKVQRKGALKNPFVQHHQPKVVTATTEASSAAPPSTSSSASQSAGSTGSSNASTGGTSDTPAPSDTTDTTPKTDDKADVKKSTTFRVAFAFGEEGAMRTYNNVARLTPLPSSDNPFFVYLGLAEDGKSAIFLISGAAETSGDGKCMPSADDCQQIALKAGDTEFLDVASGTAGTVEYTLTVKAIKKTTAASTATAAKARARESKAGREYLRQLVAEDPTALDAWNYNRSLGLLVSKDPVTTPDVANVPSTVASSADGQGVGSTSTVLTVPGS